MSVVYRFKPISLGEEESENVDYVKKKKSGLSNSTIAIISVLLVIVVAGVITVAVIFGQPSKSKPSAQPCPQATSLAFEFLATVPAVSRYAGSGFSYLAIIDGLKKNPDPTNSIYSALNRMQSYVHPEFLSVASLNQGCWAPNGTVYQNIPVAISVARDDANLRSEYQFAFLVQCQDDQDPSKQTVARLCMTVSVTEPGCEVAYFPRAATGGRLSRYGIFVSCFNMPANYEFQTILTRHNSPQDSFLSNMNFEFEITQIEPYLHFAFQSTLPQNITKNDRSSMWNSFEGSTMGFDSIFGTKPLEHTGVTLDASDFGLIRTSWETYIDLPVTKKINQMKISMTDAKPNYVLILGNACFGSLSKLCITVVADDSDCDVVTKVEFPGIYDTLISCPRKLGLYNTTFSVIINQERSIVEANNVIIRITDIQLQTT